MAGESAEDRARRQREKAQRLLDSAERWEQGAHGERVTGDILDSLQADGWLVFHDVRWPGRERANLDHVVVGPPGVFVIDAKNWSGRVELRGNSFRAHGRRQDKTVAAAGEAALAVTSLTSPPAAATTRSVLCFVRDEPIAGWCHEVMVCSTANLREMLTSRPAVLDEAQVRLAALELGLAFRAAAESTVSPAPSRRTMAGRAGAATRSAWPAPVGRAPAPHSAGRQPRRRRRGRSAVGQLVGLALFLLLAVGLVNALPHLSTLGDRIGRSIAGQPVPAYEDCRALRRHHPDGVGTTAAVDALKRKRHRPTAAPAVYAVNRALDTDRDGVACERGQRRR